MEGLKNDVHRGIQNFLGISAEISGLGESCGYESYMVVNFYFWLGKLFSAANGFNIEGRLLKKGRMFALAQATISG